MNSNRAMNESIGPDISNRRLANLLVSSTKADGALEVVERLGALQAQDYSGALWAIGLRAVGLKIEDVVKAIADRTIVRTWPMRGTLYLVPAADAQWMVKFLAPRAVATAAMRRDHLGLTDHDFARCEAAFHSALSGGKQLLRDELYSTMEDAGVQVGGQRGMHVLRHFAMAGLLCYGSHLGKEPSFALLDEWVHGGRQLDQQEAHREIAKRYFTSHGPASIDDFARWTGLSVRDARASAHKASPELSTEKIDGNQYFGPACGSESVDFLNSAFLLPGFDELILGYKDRNASLDQQHANAICPGGNGVFLPTIIFAGKVVGTWARKPLKRATRILLSPFKSLSRAEMYAVEKAAQRYGDFIGSPVEVAAT